MSADRYVGAVDVIDWCARHAVLNSTRLCILAANRVDAKPAGYLMDCMWTVANTSMFLWLTPACTPTNTGSLAVALQPFLHSIHPCAQHTDHATGTSVRL